MRKRQIMLMILDGYGLSEDTVGNAIKAAKTPNLDKIFKKDPNTSLRSSGLAVGLPEGQMGNSEVGHTNIGAGRIVYQDLTKITKSINDGDFFANEVFLEAIKNCRKNSSNMHLMGLLSDGGVHSHNTHLYALLKLMKNEDLRNVYVHCFLDGRDVPPSSGKDYILQLEKSMEDIGVGRIATVMGRYYAMDRDNRWERVEKAYNAMVYGEGIKWGSAINGVEVSYENNITDEFVEPIIITKDNNPIAAISQNDSIIFFNFRPDRAREITRTFVDLSFKGFKRKRGFFPLEFVCMNQYDKSMPNVKVAFPPIEIKNTLGEYISSKGYKQLRIAETEKYAHVTFFFNGGIEDVSKGEDRILIPSPKVATYDLKPEMSAYEVKDKVVEKINEKAYDIIVLNFANCDMVGHTGVFNAAVKAVETVDDCVGKIIKALDKQNGIAVITADHGNADKMLDIGDEVFTAHTTSNVPFIIHGLDVELRKNGKLADIAPTILDIIGEEKPEEMTGQSLILK
jgi:2,3-bisphosphoglycerate-independent phosphoglycerate mutase